MKSCPHCGNDVANLAEVCPHCRAAVSPQAVAKKAAAIEEATREDVPDPVGYLVLGGVALVIGVVAVAGGDGGWDVVGLLLGLVGCLTVLTGVVAIGVYVGMRRFEEWKRTGQE